MHKGLGNRALRKKSCTEHTSPLKERRVGTSWWRTWRRRLYAEIHFKNGYPGNLYKKKMDGSEVMPGRRSRRQCWYEKELHREAKRRLCFWEGWRQGTWVGSFRSTGCGKRVTRTDLCRWGGYIWVGATIASWESVWPRRVFPSERRKPLRNKQLFKIRRKSGKRKMMGWVLTSGDERWQKLTKYIYLKF